MREKKRIVIEQFVVDASVIAKLYLRDKYEQHTENTDLLFLRFVRGEVNLVAPRAVTYEIPAVITKGVKAARAEKESLKASLDSFNSLGLLIMDDSDAKYEAMKLALNYSCTYYDALYLLLAEDMGCRFITADEKLIKNLSRRVSYLVHIANYS